MMGREPNAGCGKPSAPNVLAVTVSAEKSKSHSTIACFALNRKPTDVTTFDKSFCFFRDNKPANYIFRDEMPATAGTWRPVDRPINAMASDRAAGDIVRH